MGLRFMTARLINRPGLDLVKMWEGLFLTAYRDIAGVWTIGYGKTGGVYKGEVITQQQADMYLVLDLATAAAEVDARAPKATDDQFDAMVSFTFNEGIGAFRSSTLLRLFKAGNIQGAADQFLRWDKAHVDGQLVVVQGLLNRRKAERALFLNVAMTVDASQLWEYHRGRCGLC
jgi:lysozyme